MTSWNFESRVTNTSWSNQTKNTTSWTEQSKSTVLSGKILREEGFALLRETGDFLLRENSSSSAVEWSFQTKN